MARIDAHATPRASPKLGWSRHALSLGAVDSGLLPTSSGALFPRGPVELVEHFVASAPSPSDAPDDATVHELFKNRLQHVFTLDSRWPQALALCAVGPGGPSNSAHALSSFVSEVKHRTDAPQSTRQLAAAYVAVELFGLSDVSKDRTETWSFLERVLSDETTAASMEALTTLARTGAGLTTAAAKEIASELGAKNADPLRVLSSLATTVVAEVFGSSSRASDEERGESIIGKPIHEILREHPRVKVVVDPDAFADARKNASGEIDSLSLVLVRDGHVVDFA